MPATTATLRDLRYPDGFGLPMRFGLYADCMRLTANSTGRALLLARAS